MKRILMGLLCLVSFLMFIGSVRAASIWSLPFYSGIAYNISVDGWKVNNPANGPNYIDSPLLGNDTDWTTNTNVNFNPVAQGDGVMTVDANYTLPTADIATIGPIRLITEYQGSFDGDSRQQINISYWNYTSASWKKMYSNVTPSSALLNVTLLNNSLTGLVVANQPLRVRTNISFPFGDTVRFYEQDASFNYTVSPLIVCGGTVGSITRTLQLNLYDEVTQAQIAGNVSVFFDISGGENASFSLNNNATYNFCMANGSYIYANIIAQYTSPTYVTKTYYANNILLNTVNLQNISLYLLSNATASRIVFFVEDGTGALQPNVYIDMERYYVSENAYKTVEIGLTDANGNTIGYLQPYDTYYKFVLTRGNTVLYIVPSMLITTSNPTFVIPTTGTIPYYRYYGTIASSCTLSSVTHVLSCTVTDTSGAMTASYLTVALKQPLQDTPYCNETTTSPSSTLLCDLSSINGTYSWSLSAAQAGQFVQLDSGFADIGGTLTYGMEGLLLGFLLIGTLTFMFIDHSATLSVIFLAVGTVAANIIGASVLGGHGLIFFPATTVVSIVLVAMIIAYKVRS